MEELSLVKNRFIDYVDKIIENKKLSHAYLIEIDQYENDMIYIYNFIKMILCNIKYEYISNSDNPVIGLVDSNNYPDIKEIIPEGNMIKKTQLLELQKEFSNKSLLDNKRIYIIREAEKLNQSSANTMLKFLEEPEEDIVAILLADSRYHVIDTILSRCQILTLKENDFSFTLDDNLLLLLKSIIKPKDFFLQYNYFIINVIPDRIICKEKFFSIENIIISYLNSKYIDNFVKKSDCFSVFKEVSDKDILFMLSVIEDEVKKLEYNVNYKLWLDSFFSKLIIGGQML